MTTCGRVRDAICIATVVLLLLMHFFFVPTCFRLTFWYSKLLPVAKDASFIIGVKIQTELEIGSGEPHHRESVTGNLTKNQ